jgi:hypothetical protein
METRAEMIQELWDYEQNFMSTSESLRWAERGFKDYLYNLPDITLEQRYEALRAIQNTFEEEVPHEMSGL